MLGAALALTLILGGLCWWILRRQLEPVVAAARALGSQSAAGRPVELLPVARPDEIGTLIAAFNRLLQALTQREAALQASEYRWKFALEGSDHGVWDWNVDTDEKTYSKGWRTALGCTESDAMPTSAQWRARITPTIRRCPPQRWRRASPAGPITMSPSTAFTAATTAIGGSSPAPWWLPATPAGRRGG